MSKKSLVAEVCIVTIVLVGVASVLQFFTTHPVIAKYYGLIFAMMFLYVPVIVVQARGRGVDFLDRSVSSYLKSFATFLAAALVIFPLFLLAANYWEKIVYNSGFNGFAILPDLWKAMAFQFIMVALPEEFFFRGYMQSVLNTVFPRNWSLLGANLGWAWIITAVVFAAAHSFVVLAWWHFAIFFPALVFGYLREKTGSITAPTLFHGASNIIMAWIGYLYG